MAQAKKDINILDLSSILQSLSAAKRSGTLKVSRENESKMVYFRRGSVEAVSAPRKKHMLGEALMKYGAITEEQLHEALHKQKDWNVDLGGALLKLGSVKEDEIRKALHFQIMEEVCEIFTWSDVHCEFTPGEPPESITKLSRDGVQIAVNAESMVMEAARRIDEWEILKQMFPSMQDVLVATPKAFHYYSESEDSQAEIEVLSYIDGVRDVDEILEKARMSKFDALKTLYKLLEAKEIAPIEPVQLVQLAINCSATGQLGKCAKLYERALELNVSDLDLEIRLAKTYEALGTGDKAIEMYARHAEKAMESNQLENAVLSYHKIVTLDKWQIEAHEKLTQAFVKLNRREEAIKEARRLADKLTEKDEEARAVAIWEKMKVALPDSPEPYEQLAELHGNSDRMVQAIIELENLAGLYQVNEQPDKAVDTYRMMLKLDKECVQARLSLSATLADMGETEEAVREYNALAETLSKSGVIHDTGNWSFLIDIYEKILDLEPNNVLAREWLTKAYIENKMIDKALICLRQIAEAKRAEGRLKEVPEHLKEIIKLQADDIETQMELAKVYLELDDNPHAVEVLRNVINMSLQKKEFGIARKAADRVLKASPHDLIAHRALAEIYEDVGETDKQARELKIVGWLCYCGGDFKAAVDSFSKVLSLDPDHTDIKIVLPELFFMLGEKKRAFDEYLILAAEMMKRNDLSLARWAGEKASRIDGSSNKIDRILSQVDDKEATLKKGANVPTIERPKSKRISPVAEKEKAAEN